MTAGPSRRPCGWPTCRPTVDRLGPLPVADDAVRMLLRAPLEQRPALAAALVAMKAVRSARKEKASVQVRMDPRDPADLTPAADRRPDPARQPPRTPPSPSPRGYPDGTVHGGQGSAAAPEPSTGARDGGATCHEPAGRRVACQCVRRSEVDGVPAFWVDSGRPTLTASPHHPAGHRRRDPPDDGLDPPARAPRAARPRQGTAAGRRRRCPAAHHASTRTGRLTGVADACSRPLTRWLADPDLSRAAERGVRAAGQEAASATVPVSVTLWRCCWRYGAGGPGSVGLRRAGPARGVAETHVR